MSTARTINGLEDLEDCTTAASCLSSQIYGSSFSLLHLPYGLVLHNSWRDLPLETQENGTNEFIRLKSLQSIAQVMLEMDST
ncbi:hypothetical protein VTO42DRAFT_5624 [Malbranchea cinnamomea]